MVIGICEMSLHWNWIRPLVHGCGRCMEVCPHQVFELTEKRAVISDLDACMECGACARNCPAAAIRVDAGVGCASGLINEWLRERHIPGRRRRMLLLIV